MTILNVREVTRGGRIGDFSPPLIVLRFSWGGWEGGAFNNKQQQHFIHISITGFVKLIE